MFGIWFLIGAALVFFMQCGFAMVETGFTRAKNAGNIHIFNKTTMPGVTMIAMRICVQRFLNLKRSTVIQVR